MVRSFVATYAGKLTSSISRTFGLGAGATWPGEVALWVDPNIVRHLSKKLTKGTVLVAGTNGKTTTTRMIQTILEADGQSTVHNKSGANLLNGIASSLLDVTNNKTDWGIFEIDENSLPHILAQVTPTIIILLNLFRDQLDRYGEVDVIAEKWQKALQKLPASTMVILNADDPLIAHLGKFVNGKTHYVGLDEPTLYQKKIDHATDSTFCLNCGARLTYTGLYYSHIGVWHCPSCGEKRPKPDTTTWEPPLPGLYNRYNTLAAVAAVKLMGVPDAVTKKALANFKPAFGRQEGFDIHGKKVKLFLSKNPTGFNESLRAVLSLGAKQILFVLNDRIPDGRDVSWIWDVDFEMIPKDIAASVSGDRVYDMAVRLKYAEIKPDIYEHLSDALSSASENKKDVIYVLATYSGMLDVRKILTGKKIL
jgi:UDP-N-acetylmuramyl tripeptide synthase